MLAVLRMDSGRWVEGRRQGGGEGRGGDEGKVGTRGEADEGKKGEEVTCQQLKAMSITFNDLHLSAQALEMR